jgi:hypothetical protein
MINNDLLTRFPNGEVLGGILGGPVTRCSLQVFGATHKVNPACLRAHYRVTGYRSEELYVPRLFFAETCRERSAEGRVEDR